MSCVYCNMAMHEICTHPKYGTDPIECCCPKDAKPEVTTSFMDAFTADTPVVAGDANKTITRSGPGRPKGSFKLGSEMKDVLKAGRRRAAVLLPTGSMGICTWSGLLYAGGGIVPIIGCNESRARDRHHGPDKSVLENTVGINLHAICKPCHNRWHVLNDKYYGSDGGADREAKGEPWKPLPEHGTNHAHDPNTKYSLEQYERSQFWWDMHPTVRPEYRSFVMGLTGESESASIHTEGTDDGIFREPQ